MHSSLPGQGHQAILQPPLSPCDHVTPQHPSSLLPARRPATYSALLLSYLPSTTRPLPTHLFTTASAPLPAALSHPPPFPCRDEKVRPFRCLDPQYRRELVRVYLTNVESICRKFCEEKRQQLSWLREEAAKFAEFWASLSPEQQRRLMTERGEHILKVGGGGLAGLAWGRERLAAVASTGMSTHDAGSGGGVLCGVWP
jgi:hypothetical protein